LAPASCFDCFKKPQAMRKRLIRMLVAIALAGVVAGFWADQPRFAGVMLVLVALALLIPVVLQTIE
jgi:diacylglycerol kinase